MLHNILMRIFRFRSGHRASVRWSHINMLLAVQVMIPMQTQRIFVTDLVTRLTGQTCLSVVLRCTICLQVPVPEKMVATVHTLLASSKHVQPDEQLLHLGLQNTGAYQVSTVYCLEIWNV